MLSHLELAGVLNVVSGVLLGRFTTGDLDPERPTLSLNTVFDDYFGDRPYPVVKGLPYGHRLPRCTLPIGVPTQLQASDEDASVTVQSPVVSG
jgi:muramoyltetrapeptide carboxypeptidase